MVYGGVDVSWEWMPEYRLRNTIYPCYLACFLWVVKFLRIDYFAVVRVCPYLAHSILVILSDRFFWKLGKKALGIPATRFAFIFYLSNRVFNEYYVRCFTNSIETIFQIIAFYYYMDVKDRFNKTTAIMTALISVSFMMRNTSPVGWIPLLVLKIIHDKSFCAFATAGFLVALPTMCACVLIDSLYFGEFAITSYNFLRANILEGLSYYFGTEPWYFYVTLYLPWMFHISYIPLLYSFYVYVNDLK